MIGASTVLTQERAVLSVAVGKPIYVAMAVNLARSFFYWNDASDIRFVLVTDQPEAIPGDVHELVELRVVRNGELGRGFSPKIFLDRLAPADRTLFIDADCLCVGRLDSVFDRFAGRAVSVVGGAIASGEWFGDVGSVCRHFGVPALPKFNGGVYYLERGPQCTAVYDSARSIEASYDEVGLVRLRGHPNDELLVAIAMALHGESGIADDGSIMADPMNFASGLEVDVLRGRASLYNTPGHSRHRAYWALRESHPLIVHFLNEFTERSPYTAEAAKLERVSARGWPAWAARAYADIACSIPDGITDYTKRAFRPAFHRLFGTRPVKVSPRL